MQLEGNWKLDGITPVSWKLRQIFESLWYISPTRGKSLKIHVGQVLYFSDCFSDSVIIFWSFEKSTNLKKCVKIVSILSNHLVLSWQWRRFTNFLSIFKIFTGRQIMKFFLLNLTYSLRYNMYEICRYWSTLLKEYKFTTECFIYKKVKPDNSSAITRNFHHQAARAPILSHQ